MVTTKKTIVKTAPVAKTATKPVPEVKPVQPKAKTPVKAVKTAKPMEKAVPAKTAEKKADHSSRDEKMVEEASITVAQDIFDTLAHSIQKNFEKQNLDFAMGDFMIIVASVCANMFQNFEHVPDAQESIDTMTRVGEMIASTVDDKVVDKTKKKKN